MSGIPNHHLNPEANTVISSSLGKDSHAFEARRSVNSISLMPASLRDGFVARFKFKNVTKAEKVLSVSLAFACIVVLLLLILVICMFFNPKIISGLIHDNRCLSPVCVSAGKLSHSRRSKLVIRCVPLAAEILSRLDESVDPCDDFYKFSCGGLDNNYNPIPDDKSSLSTASILQLEIDKRLRGE